MRDICRHMAMTTLLVTILSTASTPVFAQKPPGDAPPFQTDEGYLLNIKNADMAVLLELYSRLTGKAILPSSDVSGKVNIINQQRVSKEQAIAIVESVLELNGFSTVVGDKVIKVVQKRNAVKRNIYLGGPDENIRPADRVETHLVGLKNTKADNAKSIITPLLSDVGNVTVDKDSNVLVLTEVASNSVRLVRILRQLDVAPSRTVPMLHSYQVRNADVQEVVKQLQTYFKARERSEGEPEPTFAPDTRLNADLVTAIAPVQEEMPALLKVFDRAAPGKTAENLTIRLEYAKAANVAQILTKLLGDDGKGGAPVDQEKKISVVADEPTNTIIVSADRRRFQEIRDVVATLDVRSKQVLVKAIIMEVTLRKGNTLGISWDYQSDQTRVRSDMGTPIATSPFSDAQNSLQGLKFAWFDPSRLSSFLNAIVTGSKVNILSSPHIMTLNNKPAEIIVGQEVPYTKDSRVSDQQAVIKTNEYRKVGVKLKVTPQITEKLDVQMDIEEEISGLQGVNANLDAPIFFTREAKATVIVRSSHTVVIGGLIRRETNETRKKIPILGDLPLIKHAFRYTDGSTEKTELIALITPVVLTDDQSADDVTTAMKADIDGQIKDRGFQKELDDLFTRVTRDTVPDSVRVIPDDLPPLPPEPVTIVPSVVPSTSDTVVRRLDPPDERHSTTAKHRELSDRVRSVFQSYREGSQP